jgi:hypothetical protein
MSYRVHPDGSITTDTLDEAIALSKRLRSAGVGPSEQQHADLAQYGALPFGETAEPSPAETSSISPSHAALLQVLNANQRRALRAIQKADRLTLDDLTLYLKQPNNHATGGIMAGITKLAQRFRVNLESLFFKTTEQSVVDAREQVIVYSPGTILRSLTITETEGEAT